MRWGQGANLPVSHPLSSCYHSQVGVHAACLYLKDVHGRGVRQKHKHIPLSFSLIYDHYTCSTPPIMFVAGCVCVHRQSLTLCCVCMVALYFQHWDARNTCLSCKDYDCWCSSLQGKLPGTYRLWKKINWSSFEREKCLVIGNCWKSFANTWPRCKAYLSSFQLGQQLAQLALQMQSQEDFGKRFDSYIASDARSFRDVV